MNASVALFIYRLFYPILKFWVVFFSMIFKSSKLAESVLLKQKNTLHRNAKSDFNGFSEEEIQRLKPYWIHASSGEFEYAKPILRQLKALSPHIPVLVTYSSPSALPMIQKTSEVDFYTVAPWDQKHSVLSFLKKWNPRCLLIARTDLWPEMVLQTHAMKIPSLLFSHTYQGQNSFLNFFSKSLKTLIYQNLSKVFVVHSDDQSELKKQLDVASDICGDTRYDQVQFRLLQKQALKTQLKPSDANPIFIAGSTWPEDEKVLLPAFVKWTDTKIILVPHEVSAQHLESLKSELKSHGLSYGLYSQLERWEEEQVLVVDQVGILADLYPWAHIAFIGGSFVKKVHSVMEPLAAGLPVFVGPYHKNNREACEFISLNAEGFPVVQSFSATEQLQTIFQNYLQQSRDQKFKIRQNIQKQIESRQGATEKVIQWLKSAKV